ncbi:MAG: hypothetical protein ABI624_18060 [Casimicrobiaceae bacterium]
MTKGKAPQQRAQSAPPPEPDAPMTPLQRIGEFVLLNRAAALFTLMAAFVLGIAGVFLAIAWQFGPQILLQRAQYAHFTGHADGRIVESWLAVEVDTASIRIPANWRASAKASPCAVVEYQGDWSTPLRRAFCGNRFGFSIDYTLPDLRTMAPRVPFAWARDERGFAVPEMRLDANARAWLAANPADTFMHDKWPAKTALEWLRLELDRPVEAAIAGWSASPAVIRVAYDPQQPSDALPLGTVETRLAYRPSWFAVVIAGIVGIALWFAGMALLPVMADMAWPGRVVITLLPLLALPWWSESFPRVLAGMSAEWASVVGEMFEDLDKTDRVLASEPALATLAGGERLVWRAGDGVYAATFGRMRFTPPATEAPSADAALAALADAVTTQMRALSETERIALLAQLKADKLVDLRAAGIVFLPAAKEALLDPQGGAALRRAARGFLAEWMVQPRETPYERELGYQQRLRFVRALADVPVPEIAIPAGGTGEPADKGPPR